MAAPNPQNLAGIQASIDAAESMLGVLRTRAGVAAQIIDAVVATLRADRKLLTCGNGGSAAEAMHLAEELVGRFHHNRRALPAICLSADPTALTCIANDWDYAEVFARQVEAHGRAGDVLIALSSSGKSPSICRALARAKKAGLTTIGLLGPSGSLAEAECTLALTLDRVPAARVQEAHLLTIHLLLEAVDAAFA